MSVQVRAADIAKNLYSRQDRAAVKGKLSFLSMASALKTDALENTGFSEDAKRLTAYKKQFSEKVSALGRDLSALKASGRLQITDGGYQSMMGSEDYENAVLEYIVTATSHNEEWAILVEEDYACLGMQDEGQYTLASGGSTNPTPADLCREIRRILSEKLLKALSEQGEKQQEEELDKWFDQDSGLNFWLKRAQRQQEFQELREHAEFLRRLRSGNVSTAELLLGGWG